MAWPALLAALAAPVIGGGMSMIGGGMSLAGGMLHAGSTAVGLGAKGIGAIGSAAGGLMPGGSTDREIQGAQQQGQPDINGKYFNEKSGRWHDRNKNNQFTSPPAQFGAKGMSGSSSLAAGGSAAGGGKQMEMDFGGTGSMNEPAGADGGGPFGMLIGLLAGMANDISAIKDLTSGILNSMIADEAEEDQQDAQMSLFNEEQLAQGEEAQRAQQKAMDDATAAANLAAGETGGDNEKGQGILGKAFGPIKSGWNKILNQPNWLKALGLGGLLWWLSNNKDGFIKGITGLLQFVKDTVNDFKILGPMEGAKKMMERIGKGIAGLFTKITESDTFKNLVSTVWPALRDFIQDFTEGMFSMIWEVSKEMLFGASGDKAIRGFAKTGISEIETLSGIQKEMGKPLTDKTVEAMAEDDPNKERIEAAKLKLWGEMREITNESKGRVQWKGIGPSGTGGLDPSGFLVGYGLAITPEAHGVDIGTLMATVPIIDGVESQWEDLKNVKMAAVIGKDATDEQAKQIENNLAKVSALAAENTELQEQLKTGDLGSATPAQMIRAIGSKTIEDVQREDINSLIEKNRKENERLLKESKELGMSNISAISAGIAEKPSLESGTGITLEEELENLIKGNKLIEEVALKNKSIAYNEIPINTPKVDVSDILPKLPTITSLREGIERDYVLRNSKGWDPTKLFKGTLSDWIRVRANTIQIGPWENTDEGKAHWEHMIRVDNMKIIGLSGRGDAHRLANLADPVGYALADLEGSGALDKFVHGDKLQVGSTPNLVQDVGYKTKMLEGLAANRAANAIASGNAAGNVVVQTGAKTSINNSNVHPAPISAKDKEWTQKILNSPRFGMYNFAN